MQTPNWSLNQFLDANTFNAAASAVSTSLSTLVAGAFVPGFLHPEAATLTVSGLVATVVAGSGFGLVTSTGVLAQASGTVTGASTSTYAVNFSAFIPGGGATTTAYLICTPTTIQQNPIQIVGPPPGHPDWNPNFQSYSAYALNMDSMAITANTVPPNNTTAFALAQCTLGSGTTTLSFTPINQLRAGLIKTSNVTIASGNTSLGIAQSQQITKVTSPATLTLPLVSGYSGVPFSFTSATTGTVLVVPQGSDLIYGTVSSQGVGVNNVPLPPGSSLTVQGEIGGWFITGGSADALGSPRTRALANFTIYVATTGSDSNDGKTVSTPFATLSKAWSTLLSNTDLNGFTVTIQLADGTYTNNNLNAGGRITGQVGPVILNGNAGSPQNVVITDNTGGGFGAASFEYAYIRVQNLTINATGSNGIGMNAYYNGQIDFTNVNFGSCNFCHIAANLGGRAIAVGNYKITGSTGSHLLCATNAVINTSSITVTLTGTPAFSSAFAVANQSASLQATSVTYSGSATGSRYAASLGGIIWTNTGGSANYFPGNSAGSVDSSTGGVYN